MNIKTQFYQTRNIFRTRYQDNKVMHLIIACAVIYVIMKSVSVILIVLSPTPKTVFSDLILPNLALQPIGSFIHKPWVLISYFWADASFFKMLGDMLWLYCFGSVIQNSIGNKEIFPMFILSGLLSGLSFVALSFFWPALSNSLILSTMPGVMALAVGSFVLMPGFRFFLTERFSIPIWAVLAIFIVLNVFTVVNQTNLMVLFGISGLIGALYIYLLKSGFRPGNYLYNKGGRIQAMVTPVDIMANKHAIKRIETLKNSKHQVQDHPSPEYVDMLLDKINNSGFKSLTIEEKKSLKNASKF